MTASSAPILLVPSGRKTTDVGVLLLVCSSLALNPMRKARGWGYCRKKEEGPSPSSPAFQCRKLDRRTHHGRTFDRQMEVANRAEDGCGPAIAWKGMLLSCGIFNPFG
ncbi:hypothetical protein HPP92_004658 [Vanilla planifolia]|uniref:Uncharacterized protein n=1 Tax=Vanilla planifolia TaxID=51239 RepID=A0A835RQR7_VANPL|nr:hypothetical protein HPP92_004658 [Vanilla planifolia]